MKRCGSALLLFLLAACGDSPDAPTGPRPEPVVVYAAFEDGDSLAGAFVEFTDERGIRVTIRDGAPAEIVAAVIEDRGAPPADVLFTRDVYGAWLAADEGALRPLGDAVDVSAVPERLRDPDGYWVAAGLRLLAIAWRPDAVDGAPPSDYAALAEPRFRGKLCLSSSELPDNRALIAMLVDELGERPAELLVRSWLANLALPVYDDFDELRDALAAGTCGVAIVSTPGVGDAAASDDADVRLHLPEPAYGNIDALGVARHARSPDAARSFIDWYLRNEVEIAAVSRLTARPVAIAGTLGDQARALAVRAGYR